MSEIICLAKEYRINCARISMRIKELKSLPKPDVMRIKMLTDMLRDTREISDTLESYYSGERSGRITFSGFYCSRMKHDTD